MHAQLIVKPNKIMSRDKAIAGPIIKFLKKTIPPSGITKLNISKYKWTPTFAAAPTIIPRQRAAPKIS